MKHLRFTLAEEKPDKEGIIHLASWELGELLDSADAEEEARKTFSAETIMLLAGGWQSWSAGWELEPGETSPGKVRLIPLLRKVSAPPWDCTQNGNAPHKTTARKKDAPGSFIMYLRAGSWYLVLAAVMDNIAVTDNPAAMAQCKALRSIAPIPGIAPMPPVCFSVSSNRRQVHMGVYIPGETGRYKNRVVADLRIFLAHGYFEFKDKIKELYNAGQRFNSLQFLGNGTPGIDFRPGGYASWYNHYTEINESIILSDLESLLKTDNLIARRYLRNKEPVVFQIDDGWEKAVGEWETDEVKFPQGLKDIVLKIEEAGLIPGIWLAPFLVTRKSRIFREKPDWLLKEGGRSHRAPPVRAGWNPHWDGEFYCLDLSRDDVLEYLRSLMDKLIDQWGFRYLKLDFLYAGFLPGTYTGITAAEYYERSVTMLTGRTSNAAGLPLAYLGCGIPLGSSYRHFPLSRIGTDTKESWDWVVAKFLRHDGRPSALLSLRDTIGRSFMNGTIYINDPDVIFLRSTNCSLTETEKELIALVNFLFAGQILCSDDFFTLTKEDLSFAIIINELYTELSPDEYGAVGLKKDVYRLESRSGKVTGIINLSNKPFVVNESSYFSGGKWLVDHRLKTDQFNFTARSISIYKLPLH